MGLGCWPLGSDAYGAVDDSTAREILTFAKDSGITFFDTSPTYGNGLSEARIGRYLPKKGNLTVATKVGMLPHQGTEINYDFSPASMVTSLHASISRLKVNSLSLVWLHSPPLEAIENDLPHLLKQIEQSIDVRAWGISLKSPNDIRWASELFDWSYVQFNFSILDQRVTAFSQFLNGRKFKTVARTPFNFGFLTRDFDLSKVSTSSKHHLSRWGSEQLNRWLKSSLRIANFAQDNNLHLDQLALRFVLDSPEIDLVIPGVISKSELERNVDTHRLPPLAQDSMEFLRSFTEETIQSSPYTFFH